MTIEMRTPEVSELSVVASTLTSWQHDDGAIQLHPGDLGWYSTNGMDATAKALRTWSAGREILAVGLLDDPRLLRIGVRPDLRDNDEFAHQLVRDVEDPRQGVLPVGVATIEARGTPSFLEALSAHGWQRDEPWIPLHLDLSEPVPKPDVRVEPIGPDKTEDWVSVHWSAFRGTPFTKEDRRRRLTAWTNMAASPFYASARSLGAFNDHNELVAVAAVWSAGEGRPGLIEPMGVHSDQRGHGYGRAITISAAINLHEMGASSAVVCAEDSNVGAVSTYKAAGFAAHTPVADMRRSK